MHIASGQFVEQMSEIFVEQMSETRFRALFYGGFRCRCLIRCCTPSFLRVCQELRRVLAAILLRPHGRVMCGYV